MDYPGQGFAKLKYSDSFFSNSWSGQSHLDHTLTSQVLDCAQKPSIPELEIQLVQYQSTVSCLQVTEAISSLRDTYTYIPSETSRQQNTLELVAFNDDVPVHLTYMPYQCLHTHQLRGQPTHMAYSDLCSIEAVVLINSLSFGREQF